MSESSAAETSNRTSGGAVVNEVKQNEQPISILNNRCTSTTRVTSVKSGNGSLRQIHQQQQQQPVLTGHSEGEDKTVAGSESLPSVEGVGERSFKPTPAKFDTGTTVRPAAAKAYINCSSVDPVNLELLEQKIKLITHGLDMSPDSSLMGSASSLNSPISFSKTPTGAVAAVSFTVPGNAEKISHRGSISTRPPNPSSKHTSSVTIGTLGLATAGPTSSALVGGIQHAEAHHHDSDSSTDLSRQNSIVHMPGDFIYFEPPLHAPLTPMSPANPGSISSLNKRHGHHISNKAIIGEDDGPQVPFTTYFQKEDDEKIHILIGATGSVATMKVPLIIDKLFKIYSPNKVSIQLVVTKRAEHFLKGLKINKEVKLWRDEDEWFGFKKPGDPVLHLELRKWADIFLVAPLSANTLAKVANGICDNLLTSLLRVWNPSIPVIVAPAMNTFMYTHPVTKKHLAMLLEGAPYIQVLKPVEKVLVCGDIGMGGMREWIEIVEILVKSISKSRSSQAAEKLGDGEDENDVNSEDDNDDEDDEDDDGRPSGEETDETDATDVSDPEAEDDEDDDEDGENPPYGESTNPSAESRIGTGNSSQLPSYNPIMDGMVTAATLRSH